MNFDTWLAFMVTNLFICASPGPNMLHMLSSGTRYGFRRTVTTMFGCFTAVFILNLASLAGLGALLSVFPSAFNLIRYLGAAYLVYVGFKSFLNNKSIIDSEIDKSTQDLIGKREIFWKGFFVGIANPKAMLFVAAFFPQFINPAESQTKQFIILMLSFAPVEFACYSLYALGGTRIAYLLKKPRNTRIFNRIIGGLFITFGILLLFYKLN